ncbi:MAG: ABC transporter permease [Fibrobacterales bacterium]
MNHFAQFLLSPFTILAQVFYSGIIGIGEVAYLLLATLKRFPLVVKNPTMTITQMINIGVSSIPLLFVTSIFTGMVAVIQVKYQFRGFVSDGFIGTGVCKMVIIELGPLLTAIVMSGRIGSALAAEIGSMKEKEELDAMVVLNLDPLRYLAMPRLIAFMVMMPCLTLISIYIALVGGWLISVLALDMTSYTYMNGLTKFFIPMDVAAALIKSFTFGTIIFLMGYYQGTHAGSGAKGVGEATMKVVVSSSVLILIFDFIIALIMF